MEEDLMIPMPTEFAEHVSLLIAAILTPAVLLQRSGFIAQQGREPTPEEFAPYRRAVVNDWIRTARYLSGLQRPLPGQPPQG